MIPGYREAAKKGATNQHLRTWHFFEKSHRPRPAYGQRRLADRVSEVHHAEEGEHCGREIIFVLIPLEQTSRVAKKYTFDTFPLPRRTRPSFVQRRRRRHAERRKFDKSRED